MAIENKEGGGSVGGSGGAKGGQSEVVKRKCEEWKRTRAWVRVFIDALHQVCKKKEVDTTFKALKKGMIQVIKDGKPFSMDVFNLCYLYQKWETNEKSVWKQAELTLKRVIDIDTLHRDPVNWLWFKSYYLKNRCLLSRIRHV